MNHQPQEKSYTVTELQEAYTNYIIRPEAGTNRSYYMTASFLKWLAEQRPLPQEECKFCDVGIKHYHSDGESEEEIPATPHRLSEFDFEQNYYEGKPIGNYSLTRDGRDKLIKLVNSLKGKI